MGASAGASTPWSAGGAGGVSCDVEKAHEWAQLLGTMRVPPQQDRDRRGGHGSGQPRALSEDEWAASALYAAVVLVRS